MQLISEEQVCFLTEFSDGSKKIEFETINYNKQSNFLNDRNGERYFSYMFKSLNDGLLFTYSTLKNKGSIIYEDKYNYLNSLCSINSTGNVVQSVSVTVPHINCGVDLMACSHELGHALRYESRIARDRYCVYNSLFEEVTSILFGRICSERYLNDFGSSYIDQVQEFEKTNIENATHCLEKISEILPKYRKLFDEAILKKNIKKIDLKLRDSIQDMANELYVYASYPIGIALTNIYENMSDNEKEDYIRLLSRYMVGDRNFNFDNLFSIFFSSLKAKDYRKEFDDYVSSNSKKLLLKSKEK